MYAWDVLLASRSKKLRRCRWLNCALFVSQDGNECNKGGRYLNSFWFGGVHGGVTHPMACVGEGSAPSLLRRLNTVAERKDDLIILSSTAVH